MREPFPQPSFTPRQVLDDADLIARFHDARSCEILMEASTYLSRVLTRPDALLGRPGAVCPFVGSALLDNMITFSILPSPETDVAMLRKAALTAGNSFPPMHDRPVSRSESLRAVIILLPHLDVADAAEMIEQAQSELKPEMVANGLMIGEFFPGCTAPGLNNPAFRPADTPFAFLALRRMVVADLPFLIENDVFLDQYLAQFGEEGQKRLQKLRPEAVFDSELLQAVAVAQSVLPGATEHRAIHAG